MIGAIGPEAKVDPPGFRRTVAAALARLAAIEAEEARRDEQLGWHTLAERRGRARQSTRSPGRSGALGAAGAGAGTAPRSESGTLPLALLALAGVFGLAALRSHRRA